MRFAFIALAFCASIALAQNQCDCVGGQDYCGCTFGIWGGGCFCEDLNNDNDVATMCTASGSCGCPCGQNGHCIDVSIFSFFRMIKITNNLTGGALDN